MKFVLRLISGLVVFILVEFLAINFGTYIGSGVNEAGLIVCAISILCGIIVICTMYIIEAINRNKV